MLTPHVRAIGRPAGPAQDDAVDSGRVEGTPAALKSDLVQLIGQDQVLHRISDLIRYASDASPYRYLPQVVVLPRTVDDVGAILDYCARTGRHATFRAGGTSLNGQSQSDDILIDVRRHWAGLVVEDGGARLRARPGTILGHANAVLRPLGRRLGPDPASADVATIGGVIANNAGGMRCTLERNAYHTVSSLTLVLASGTVVDTAAPGAEAAFAAAEPELAAGLLQLREELLADEQLAQRVRRKFSIRNTNGYALSALLDADTPLEIFRRLIVGSEGTLAFVAEAVIDTIPAPANTTVSWIALPSISEAAALVPRLVGLGAEAAELMLAPALAAAAQAFPGTPAYWRDLDPHAAALLVEFRAGSAAALEGAEARATALAAAANLVHPVEFTRDEDQIDLYWRVRDGLLGIVGQQCPDGTALIIEDVCFPPDRIAEGAQDLVDLLSKHSFPPNAAGHAAYGNLHFTLTPRLADPGDRERYSAFMADLVTLVIDKYDGSLKAEHGTGINMAPFVRHEWGDKGINLKHFKSAPPIEDLATHCIECSFCEAVCPSRNVTTTPRQRIVLRREMARQAEGSPLLARLQDEYEYDGIETCAADGSCAIPCPVQINTGALEKGFRRAESTPRRERAALMIARRWATAEKLARTAVGAADIIQRTIGVRALTGLTAAARLVVSDDLIPAVPGPMPRAQLRKLPSTTREGAAAVYFPACINRIFGRDPAQAYLSANRTCEMGLRQATGRPYESFVFLLEELTRPA